MAVLVHPHACKHGLRAQEVVYAWEHLICCRQRAQTFDYPVWIAIGVLPNGNLVELVSVLNESWEWCVIHAMVPPTKKFKRELGYRG